MQNAGAAKHRLDSAAVQVKLSANGASLGLPAPW